MPDTKRPDRQKRRNPGLLGGGATLPLRFLESSLITFDGMLRQTSSMVDQLIGQESGSGRRTGRTGASVSGPPDIDRATSDLANRWLRIAISRGRPLDERWIDAVRAMERSWPGEDLGGLRDWMTLPVRLPLSVGSLTVQETLRGLLALQSVRPELWVDFSDFIVELFSDLHVFFSLRYGDLLERQRQHLERRPGDAEARLEHGRTLMKCGLFREALEELEKVDARGGLARRARYESLVAGHRLGDYSRALGHGVACLRMDPGDEVARFWLWLTAQKLGGYPRSVDEKLRMTVVAGYEPTEIELEDVAASSGLDKTSGGRGTAVFDSNGNGRLDVVVAGAHSGVSLFRNDGVGPDGRLRFTDISTGSGLDRCVYAFAVAVGDYNNDGLQDLFLTGLGFFDGQGMLMRNNGDGTFTDVTEEAGLKMWGPAFTATWVDYDGDGALDLFVVNNLGGLFDRKTPNRLYRNNGDGTFTEVAEEAGITTPWPSLSAVWGDFWNDGRPDLFVSNIGRAQLFRNNGAGADGRVSFTDVSRAAGVDVPALGSACLCCDIDDDGWLDIVQMTYSRPQDAIHTLRTGHGPEGGSPMRVFRNNRDGTFTDIAPELGLDGCWGTMSAAAGDVSNNGHLDLLLGNGDARIDRTEASILLENDGRRFRNVAFSAGLPFAGKGHGANLADLTGDGRLHLIMGAGGLYPGDLLTTTVHQPKRRTGNYLNVRLLGTRSNRDALGARLALEAGGRRQHRLVSGGSGFGCLPYEQHFGLGDLTRVDALEIRWPSGFRQTLHQLPVNDTVRIREGEPGWERVYSRE